MFRSLQTKMSLAVGIPLLLVSFGLLYMSASQQQRAALTQAEDLSRATTREESIEIQSLVDGALSSAMLTAAVFRNVNDVDNPLDMGRESAALILRGLLGKDENYSGVFSVWEPDAFDMMDVAYAELPGNSLEGRFSPYWRSNSLLRTFEDEEISGKTGWYKDILQNPRPCVIWCPISNMPEKSPRVLRAIAPIMNDGQFLGVVGIDMGSDIFEAMVASWLNSPEESVVRLHTVDGILVAPLADEDSSHSGFNPNHSLTPGITWQENQLISVQMVESVLADTYLIVVGLTPRQTLLGPMQKSLIKNIVLGSFIALMALMFTGYFMRRNISRVVQLSKLSRHVALEEKHEHLTDESADEIGHLTRDFQSMLKSLESAKEERQESLTRLEAIYDSVQAGIVIIDPSNRTIVDANPAALKMLGHTKDHVLNKICHGLMCPAETNKCPILDLKQNADGARKVLLKSDGSELIIYKTVVPIELKGQSYLLETFVDVDKQVKAEQALEEKLAQISQAQKQQDILVNHAVSREERMVELKTEVNELHHQQGMPQRYKAPDRIQSYRQKMADEGVWEHQDA